MAKRPRHGRGPCSEPPPPPKRVELPSSPLLDKVKAMQLRKVVRENHGSPILQCVRCPSHLAPHAIVSLSATQVNLYNDRHCGSFLDLTAQYVHAPSEDVSSKALTCCAWVVAAPKLYVVLGTDVGEVLVFDVMESSICACISAHTGAVVDVMASAGTPRLFVSTSADGTTSMWDCASSERVGFWPTSGTALACLPSTHKLLLGDAKGQVHVLTPDSTTLLSSSGLNLDAMFGLRSDAGDRVVCKDAGGQVVVLSESGGAVASFQVPSQDATVRARFGATPCGTLLFCGTSTGKLAVYDVEASTPVHTLSFPRIRGAVTCVSVAPDTDTVVFSTNNQFLWRWDFPPATALSAHAFEESGQ